MTSRSTLDNWRLSAPPSPPNSEYFTGVTPDTKRLPAILYAEGGLHSSLGKTAHGLLRYSPRYAIATVVDSTYSGSTVAGADGPVRVTSSLPDAIRAAPNAKVFVIGIAPTGVTHTHAAATAARCALRAGISVHNGLHLFLSEIPSLRRLALKHSATILDIRKPPRRALRMFTGDLASISTPRILVTGQDAAIGKRTTCVRIAQQVSRRMQPCLIGTGQTAWLQAFPYGIRLDALPIDFVTGEIEGAILQAVREQNPQVVVIEGQGSLLNPGYGPETLALLLGALPTAIIYVMASGRTHYVDFPSYPLPPAAHEIALIEALTAVPVIGVVVNDAAGSPNRSDLVDLGDRPVSIGVDGDLSNILAAIPKGL